MRKDNTLFVPTGSSWILTPRDALPTVLQTLAVLGPTGRCADLSGTFVQITMQAGEAAISLRVASTLTTDAVLRFCGKSEHLADIPKEWGPHVRGMTLNVEALPQLDAFGSFRGGSFVPGIVLWLVPGNAFLLDSSSPMFWPQVLQVVDSFQVVPPCVLALYTLQGQRLTKWDPDQACVVASLEHPDQRMFPITFWAGLRPEVSIEGGTVKMHVRTASEFSPAWLGMPFTPLLAAGWQTQVSGFPPELDQGVTFTSRSIDGTLGLAVGQVRELHRLWLLVAEFENVQLPPTQTGIQVQVQVADSSFWRGVLPAALTISVLQDFWAQASASCGLPDSADVFSGSYCCPPHLRLGQVPGANGPGRLHPPCPLVLAFQATVCHAEGPSQTATTASTSLQHAHIGPGGPQAPEIPLQMSPEVGSNPREGPTLTRVEQFPTGTAQPDPDPAKLARVEQFVHSLQSSQSDNPSEGVEVEVQVVASKVWRGRLPGRMQLVEIEGFWRRASHIALLPPACRIFSGPFPCPCSLAVGDVQSQQSPRVLVKQGRLVLTVHPAIVGGGVKVENGEWTGSRVASLCLSRGCPLAATTDFVDRILVSAGVSKVMAVVASGPEGKRWDELKALAEQQQVPMPVPTNGVAKAAERFHKSAQRKKQQHDRNILAHEVRVEPGFFSNEDGTPCALLEQVTPGATGLVLANLQEASSLCNTLEGIQPDELAVLVLGHQCPDAHSCDGAVSFPAQLLATDSKVLLAGCLHNFGDKKVRCQRTAQAEIELEDVTCCQFVVYADELEPARWKAFTETPVRAASETFQYRSHYHL